MIFFGMNVLVLFASIGIDSQLCGRLCLMLAHSVWQVGLLALVATLLVRFQRRENPELGYAVYVTALLVGLAALSITYSLVRIEPQTVKASLSPVADLRVVEPIVQPQIEQSAQLSPQIAAESGGAQPSTKPAAMSNESQAETFLLRFAPWLAGCYAVGVVVMLLRLGQGIWKSYKLARDAKPVGDGLLNQAFQKIVRAWSLRVMPVLAEAQEIIVPQVVGLLRPTILLPTSALTGLSPEELEMILAHELAHVRRYDMWVNLLQRLAESILFFNLALWYLTRRISAYREYCCDEQTCRVKQDEAVIVRLRYAQALLHVVELSGKGTQSAEIAALAATGAGPSELRRRVARLFGEPLREPIGLSRNAILSVIAGLVLGIAGPAAWQNAAETKTESAAVLDEKPSDTKVEVVAIGTHDEEPQQWWDVEGKPLTSLPFTWKKERGSVTIEGDVVWRRVVIRIDGEISNSPLDRIWEIVGARGASGGTIEFIGAFEPGTYLTRYFGMTNGADTFGLRVGIARGDWQTIVKASNMGAYGAGGKSVVFSEPMTINQSVDLIVSHNVKGQAYRIVAIDKQGKLHESVRSGGSSSGEVAQSRATFPGLTLDDVDHYEFQTRKYEWTEIKNLPVEPSKKVTKAPNKTHEMRIKVVDTDGKPISGAKVFRSLTIKYPESIKVENKDYFSNEDGETVVALAGEPIDLGLWVSKPGYVPMNAAWTEQQQKNGDQIPDEFEVRMKRGTKISGIVTNVAGIPIPGVKVEVTENTRVTFADESELPKPFKRPGRSLWLAWGSAGVMTNAEGRWTVENIPSDEELNSTKFDSPEKAPLLLRFSHPEYETIDGIEDYQTVWNPPLEQLRDGTSRTVMNWVDKDDLGRKNAIRLEQGETYEGTDFHGRHFAGQQQAIVLNDRMLKGADLSDSVWEDMLIPGMDSSFQETNFTRARLKSIFLTGQSGAFQNAIFDGASLEGAGLSGGVSGFQQSRFDNASITNSSLDGGASAFQDSSFRGAKFHSSKVTASGSALQKANFDDAKIVKTAIVCNSPTAFQGVSLNNAEFVEADLRSIDAESLRSCEFNAATPPRYDAKTKFPEGFDPEEQGWKLIE